MGRPYRSWTCREWEAAQKRPVAEDEPCGCAKCTDYCLVPWAALDRLDRLLTRLESVRMAAGVRGCPICFALGEKPHDGACELHLLQLVLAQVRKGCA